MRQCHTGLDVSKNDDRGVVMRLERVETELSKNWCPAVVYILKINCADALSNGSERFETADKERRGDGRVLELDGVCMCSLQEPKR